MKHTPGPWNWDDGEDQDLPKLLAPSSKVCDFGNAEQYYPTSGDPPNEADAHLIAAAPELLAALKRLHDCYSVSHSQETRQSCWDQAISAITKAEGESK